MLANTQMLHGMECITVHPTFLYESLWNLMLLIFLLIYRKHQKFTGAVVLIVGYVRRAKGQLQTIENESVQAPSEDENN